MARLPDPTESLDPEAKKLYDAMAAKRGRIDGMYGSMLNHPELTRHVSNLGAFLRFESTLPGKIRELAILTVARKLNTPYEWVKHVPPGEKEGLTPDVVEAVKNQTDLSSFSPFYPKIRQLAEIVLEEKSIPTQLQEEIEKELGVKGIIELVILVGFYRMIADFIKAFDVPLPPGDSLPF